MRTTLTLEPDVARKLKKKMIDGKRTLKETVNEALRIRLSAADKPRKPFQVKPHSFGFAADIDLNKMNQLNDELEIEDQPALAME